MDCVNYVNSSARQITVNKSGSSRAVWEGARKDPRQAGQGEALCAPVWWGLVTGKGAAARRSSSLRHRRGAGEEGGRACRPAADRHAPRSVRQRGQGGEGGYRYGKTFRRVFYAAQIDLEAHPRPALEMTMNCIFHRRLPLTIQKHSEQSERRNKTPETQVGRGFWLFRPLRVFRVCSDCLCRNTGILPHF